MWILCSAFSIANGAERVALVIGNSAYQYAPKLPNPIRDAEAISATLDRLGFKVISSYDQTKSQTDVTLRNFYEELETAKVSLFYYAGHGLQFDDKNYLVPVDAVLNNQGDLFFEAIPLMKILGLMEDQTETNLVFLDACRDNPLAKNLSRSLSTRSTSVGRGFGEMNAGTGTLIVYSTEPGNVALDGYGQHSPFTKALLNHIDTPDMEIREMLSNVRKDVLEDTNGAQKPWDEASLIGGFYFAKIDNNTPIVEIDIEKEKYFDIEIERYKIELEIQKDVWNESKLTNTIKAYNTYIQQYPDGIYIEFAKNRITDLNKIYTPNTEDKADEIEPNPDETDNPSNSIQQLVKQCEEHYNDNRLTYGEGGNAFDCYSDVLKKSSENEDALTGIKNIQNRYVEFINTAINRKNSNQAMRNLIRLKKVNPNHQNIAAFTNEINYLSTAKLIPENKPGGIDRSSSATGSAESQEILQNRLAPNIVKNYDNNDKPEPKIISSSEVFSPENYYQRAQRNMAEGNFKKALEDYSALIEKYPKSPLTVDSNYEIANIYISTNQWNKALKLYSNIANLSKNSKYKKKSIKNIAEIYDYYCTIKEINGAQRAHKLLCDLSQMKCLALAPKTIQCDAGLFIEDVKNKATILKKKTGKLPSIFD